jgi:hypothetical protein
MAPHVGDDMRGHPLPFHATGSEAGTGTTAGCAAAAGPTAQDPAASGGVDLADTGCVATASRLGRPCLRKEGLGDPLNLFCRSDAFAGSIPGLFPLQTSYRQFL